MRNARVALSISTALVALCLAAPAFAESAKDDPLQQVVFNSPQPTSGTEDHPIPVLLPVADHKIAVSIQVDVANGRIFQDQEFVLTRRPVVEANLNIALPSGYYGNLWHAQSLVGRHQDYETDFGLGKISKISKTTVTTEVTYFEFTGKDDWQGYVDVQRPLSKSCTGSLRATVLRGSLNDEIYRAQATCTRGQLDVTVALAHERTFGADGVEYSVGYKLFKNLPFRVFAKGYAGSLGADAIYGVDLCSISF